LTLHKAGVLKTLTRELVKYTNQLCGNKVFLAHR
jgi:hypothetical protein